MSLAQSSSSLGTLPPLAAMRVSTALCSQVFILAESAMRSAGQFNSVASSLRAVRLLSMSRSLSRSTIEVRQFSFWALALARCSSCATTSTISTGLGAAGAAGAVPAGGAVGVVEGAVVGALGTAASSLPMPSFSRILLKNPMVLSLVDWRASMHPQGDKGVSPLPVAPHRFTLTQHTSDQRCLPPITRRSEEHTS